jgi:glycosyltransferase involved in cell wall biosynthesis
MKPGVLIIGNFLSGAGFARGVCEDLAEHLSRAGWRIATASSRPGRWARLRDMLATVWRERGSYDVAQVDVYSGKAFMWAELVCAALRQAGKPYVLTLHGGNLPRFARRWPGRLRRLLQSAAFVTSPSSFLADSLRRVREDILVIPNPLEIGRYPFSIRSEAHPRLVWLRAFHRTYNPRLAPRVVALLAEEFPDVSLVMVGRDRGDGSLQETQDLARRLGVTARVSFPGGVSKAAVPDWLNRGDIFLNTTDVDNTPVSVLEAMACGMCVVSTDVGGLPYLLEDGRTALLVPPDDPLAMAGGVRRLLERPELSERLSRSARQAAEAFQWGAILPKWEALLREGAHSRGGVPEGSPAEEARRFG